MDRRVFLKTTTGLFVAPAIVRASSLMPIFFRKDFPIEFITLAMSTGTKTFHHKYTWNRKTAVWLPSGDIASATYDVVVSSHITQNAAELELDSILQSWRRERTRYQ